MRKTSLIEKVSLFGRSGIDIVEVIGRSTIFLFHALLGRGGIGGGFGLLLKQLHSVGVMSLVIIVVSGVFIGMVLALQGFNIHFAYKVISLCTTDVVKDHFSSNVTSPFTANSLLDAPLSSVYPSFVTTGIDTVLFF